MKNFIEVHTKHEKLPILVSTRHITEVRHSDIYMDDTLASSKEYSYIPCAESYEEIKSLIERAEEQ